MAYTGPRCQTCNKPNHTEYKNCARCRRRACRYALNTKRVRRYSGLCTRCGLAVDTDGRYCASCREWARLNYRRKGEST